MRTREAERMPHEHGTGPGRHHRWGPRARRGSSPERWEITARVERVVEPTLLLLLSERPMHGYELLDRLTELMSEGWAIDVGNLYRVLRGLEAEELVRSTWGVGALGPARRVYEITPAGAKLLDQWATALERTRLGIARFLARYRVVRGRNTR
jgi:PadR family transcriptional regulator PadR